MLNMTTNKRFNTIIFGIIPGFLVPILALVGIWMFKYHGDFFDFLFTFQQLGLLTKVLSLATLPNLILFFIFIWSNRSFSARGVIFSTLVIAFVMLVLKFS
jgi:hypothetical protein